MLYSKGHGRPACMSRPPEDLRQILLRTFRYYDKTLPEVTHDAQMAALLKGLGEAMTNADNFPSAMNSELPTFFTYLGQFLDHDLSAGTDFDASVAEKTAALRQTGAPAGFEPLDRNAVEAGIGNQNTAKLDLDSVYGDVIVQTEFDAIFAKALRSTRFPGMMRIARPQTVPEPPAEPGIVPKPEDGAGDLLRLGEVLGTTLPEDLLLDQPADVQDIFFFFENGQPDRPNRSRAIIGDARNDENLFVAQVHLAMLRLHNRIVANCTDQNVVDAGSDALFEWAKKRVRWIYQWVIVNEFLKGICDPTIYASVLADEGQLYRWFLAETGGATADGRLPLPLEFSVAAYRFGHSMARDSYDWNQFFPEGDGTLELLFQFTGGVQNPMFGVTEFRLPSDWVIDWSFHEVTDPSNPFRATFAIDTNLARPLGSLPAKANDPVPAPSGPNLAVLNLMKGHLLNLPSAQDLISALNSTGGYALAPLSTEEIASGPTASAVAGTRLASETPLWFYILKEAELRHHGQRLGPLGSLIVASTILGVVVEDQSSYWNEAGSDAGRWHPADAVQPAGVPVTSFSEILRAGLLL